VKLLPIEENGVTVGYLFSCPGCENSHAPYVRPHKAPNGASWEFDGNLISPTFSPSILARVENPFGGKVMICHSFVNAGKVRFLADCTHKLAGQEVELPEID
jgi:hypothetical protein